MTARELKDLLERVRAWPEEAQNELVAVANQIENELHGNYVASRQELEAIDEAVASLDAGEFATDEEVQAAFAKFRSA
jgi:predicted transcriptional regulator